jgi:hypothetical protein
MFVPAGNYALTTAFTFGTQTGVTVLISAGVTLTGAALPAATGTNAYLDLRAVGGAVPLSGGATLTGNLLFSPDNTYSIGAPGANRPANITTSQQVNVGSFLGVGVAASSNQQAFILANSTTTIGLIIRGVAAQTADLLDLQNSAGSNIFQFTSTASMVNGLSFVPSNTGAVVQIQAIGADIDLPFVLASKGVGAVRLTNGAVNLGWFAPVASAVNYLQFNPSITGNPASIQSAGTDASIGLTLLSKGAGGGITLTAGLSSNMVFTAGAYQFTGAPVFFRDGNNATTLQLAQVVSAVNALQISPSVATAQVLLAVVGADVNAGMDVDSKGGGQLRLNRNSGADIAWGRALVPLGGGVAPTFGTIGGTGPATAAQNTWMRVIDSTGVAFFVPVWK